MEEVEALRISEKLNVYGKVRAEALCTREPASWYVVASIDESFEWDDDKVKQIATAKAPSAALIQVAREPRVGGEHLIVTSIPKRLEK